MQASTRWVRVWGVKAVSSVDKVGRLATTITPTHAAKDGGECGAGAVCCSAGVLVWCLCRSVVL